MTFAQILQFAYARLNIGDGLPVELLYHYMTGRRREFLLDSNDFQAYTDEHQFSLVNIPDFENHLNNNCSSNGGSWNATYRYLYPLDDVNPSGGLNQHFYVLSVQVDCCPDSNGTKKWKATGTGQIEDSWDFFITFEEVWNDPSRRNLRTYAGSFIIGDPFPVTSRSVELRQNWGYSGGEYDTYIRWEH